MVFSTTLRSSVELTARPTSPKAVRSRLRTCTSSNSRTFSIAMTAWSAKVSISAIWLWVNRQTLGLVMTITPSSSSARSIGIASTVRMGPTCTTP